MATSLITNLPVILMSSNLGDIEFSTDEEQLEITLEDGLKEMFKVSLYSYNGKLTLSNLREVVEDYMIDKGESFIAFTLYYNKVDGTNIGEQSLWVLYCSVVNNADALQFGKYNFLTTLSAKRVPRGANERLFIFTGQDFGYIKAHCVYKTSRGKLANATVSLNRVITNDLVVEQIDVKYSEILAKLQNEGYDVAIILSYSIEYNDRYFTYYVTDKEPCISFTFKNCFNVDEIAYFNAITTTKTKVNRSMAISHGEHLFYDQSVDKTYEVQTASLTADEADWVEQLFYSHAVRLGVSEDSNTLPKVIITESTCEIEDNDEQLNKVKFTWQFAVRTPHLIKSFRADTDGIFTEPYNNVFN